MRKLIKVGAARKSGIRPSFVFIPRRLLTGLLFGSVIFSPWLQAADSLPEPLLQEIFFLTDVGAESLGMHLLADVEPDLEVAAEAWIVWHRQKVVLLQQKGRWSEVVHEYEALPVNVPASHQNWLFSELVHSYLAMAAGEQARDLLLSLIWDSFLDKNRLPELRRLVLQSYLVDGRYENARTALLRYEQDYPNAELDYELLALKARLMIASGRANEAAVLTVVSDEPVVRSVYVLALLKGLTPLDTSLLAETLRWLAEPQLGLAFKQSLFAALFEKVKRLDDLPKRIAALEDLLGINNIGGAQVTAVVDALWFVLTEYGSRLANGHQLLMGNFGPWFELAEAMEQPNSRKAEAIYAWLALKAQGADINARAHGLLVTLLEQQGHMPLLRAMYLSSSQFANVSVLPLAVIYRLVDMALADADLGLASKLMSQLDAPKGVDIVEWQLRRARVQILAGAPDYGIELLKEIVAVESLSQAQVANVLLAAQDLNSKAKLQPAFSLLAELLHKLPDSSSQRELLYWMAEIRMAQLQYSEAARLYLQSAHLGKRNDKDDWVEAARHRAAHALEQAGLLSDALNIYQTLSAATEGGARRIYDYQVRRLKSSIN